MATRHERTMRRRTPCRGSLSNRRVAAVAVCSTAVAFGWQNLIVPGQRGRSHSVVPSRRQKPIIQSASGSGDQRHSPTSTTNAVSSFSGTTFDDLSARFEDEVGWVPSDAWVVDNDEKANALLPFDDESPSDTLEGGNSVVELPLVVVDAPLLPCGTHSMPVVDDRLRRLYDEILLSGGRRFVVALGERRRPNNNNDARQKKNHHDAWTTSFEPPRVAEIGTVLYLTDVKDDAQSGVRTCEHGVLNLRVKIHKILERSQGRLYARVGVVFDDDDVTRDGSAVAALPPSMVDLAPSSASSSRRRQPPGTDVDAGSEPGSTKPTKEDLAHASSLLSNLLNRLETLVQDAFAAVGSSPSERAGATASSEEVPAMSNPQRGGGVLQRLVAQTAARATTRNRRRRAASSENPPLVFLRNRKKWLREEEARFSASSATASSTVEETPAHERMVMSELFEIAALQKRLDEDVCFREEAVAALGAGPGVGVGSLWHLANSCWLSYLKARATTRARRVYSDLHDRLVEFLRQSGKLPPEFYREDVLVERSELALSITELPKELRKDLLRLKPTIADEIDPILSQHKAAQTLLHANSHTDRCLAFYKLLNAEKRRLTARAVLRDTFPSSTGGRSSRRSES